MYTYSRPGSAVCSGVQASRQPWQGLFSMHGFRYTGQDPQFLGFPDRLTTHPKTQARCLDLCISLNHITILKLQRTL